MTENEFLDQAEAVMNTIEDALDECETDIDFDTMGEVLTLIFENGSQVIINKQTPLKQIWVAAKSGGFHFDFNELSQRWVLNNDPNKTLVDSLNLYCSEQSGEDIKLAIDF